MTRVPPRTSFHSSQLVRCLLDLAILDAADPGNAFAEKLGLWIHFTDAITLSAVHNDGLASLPDVPPRMQEQQVAACAECERLRASLATSILESCSSSSGRTHLSLPTPPSHAAIDIATAYLPYRRFYEAHQRNMELRIQPLRFNVRDAVAKASPRLGRLAGLDATLETILRERESKLLSKVPVLLKKRFEQLFKEHQQKCDDVRQADNPATWTRPEAWLMRFCKDMQMLLLAELDFRLQPTMGLIEACKQDTQ